jgi:integrase/recombinase XerD
VSALEQALADYLRLRHSLGHELAEVGWLLPGFVAYLGAHGSPTVTIEAALAWAQQVPKSPAGRVTIVGPRRMTAARGFARYLSGIDAGTEGPPLGLIAGRRAGGAGSRSRRSSTPHAGTAAATRPVA